MNDDELGRILQGELRRRVSPPPATPEAVYRHVEDLRAMERVRGVVRLGLSRRGALGIAAAVAICALVAAGLSLRPANRPPIGAPGPKDGIEAFGRIDAQTAWAESGASLYVTRDGGASWSEGTVPGGLSPADYFQKATSGSSTNTAAPGETPTDSDREVTQASDPALLTPDHFYPQFVDADHGWLLSWTGRKVDGSIQMTLTVWRTSDAGKHWASSQVPGTFKGIGLVQFADESHGWITVLRSDLAIEVSSEAGATPTPKPALPADTTTILASADGGVTWTPTAQLAVQALPRFVSPTEAWGFAKTALDDGPNSVIHSTDGGRSWSLATLPLPGGGQVAGWPEPPSAKGRDLVIQLGYQDTSGAGIASSILTFTSYDAGSSWTLDSSRPQSGVASTQLNTLASILSLPVGQPVAVPIGTNSTTPTALRATWDGGLTWSEYQTPAIPGSTVTLAEWTSPDDMWVMSMPSSSAMSYMFGGRLYSSRDGGKTWQLILGSESSEPPPLKTPEVEYVTPPIEVATASASQRRRRLSLTTSPTRPKNTSSDTAPRTTIASKTMAGSSWPLPSGNTGMAVSISHSTRLRARGYSSM